jgi:fatty-acyl-CoA synthase
MAPTTQFPPLRNLQDIEEFEREPLKSRLLSQDANDWLRHGLDIAPQKIAIRYVHDGNPQGPTFDVTYAQLKRDSLRAAKLFHELGVGPGDAVLYLLPTMPQFYSITIGAMAASISHYNVDTQNSDGIPGHGVVGCHPRR